MYGLIDIFDLDTILNTCSTTERPPKPSKNETNITIVEKLFVWIKHNFFNPFVTSTIPKITLLEKLVGILNTEYSTLERIDIILLDCSIEVITENRTTKPPIVTMVLTDFVILVDKISPKLEKLKLV